MSVKISELNDADPLIGDEELPIVQNGNTYKTNITAIQTLPTNVFSNDTGEITLDNWGFWDASTNCVELVNINVPDPANYLGKFLILRNSNNIDIPIGNGSYIADIEGNSISVLSAYRAFNMISNGDGWILISLYSA